MQDAFFYSTKSSKLKNRKTNSYRFIANKLYYVIYRKYITFYRAKK